MLLLTLLLACGGGGSKGVVVPEKEATVVQSFKQDHAGKTVWSVRYVRRQLSFDGKKLPWDSAAENDPTLPALVVTARQSKAADPVALVSLGGGVSFFDTTRLVASVMKSGAKAVYLHSAETNEVLGPLVSPEKPPAPAAPGEHSVSGGSTDLRIEVHASSGDHWAVAAASFVPTVTPGPGLPASVGGTSAETPTDAATARGATSTVKVDCEAVSGGDASLKTACEQAPAGAPALAVLGCITPPVGVAEAVDQWRAAGESTLKVAAGGAELRQTLLLMEDDVPLVAWWELWAATEGKAVIGGGLMETPTGQPPVCPAKLGDPAMVASLRAQFLGGIDGGPVVSGEAPAAPVVPPAEATP